MTSRPTPLAVIALVVVALSGCSAPVGATETPTNAGGVIELAAAETCSDGSDPECVLINGESVLLPSAFERAGVEEAAVAAGDQNAVDVTFDDDGALVLQTVTEQVFDAGDTARLVIRIEGETVAAVVVMEALTGDQVQIALSPEDSAQDVVDGIRAG